MTGQDDFNEAALTLGRLQTMNSGKKDMTRAFRVNKETWELFQSKCRKAGVPANTMLTMLVTDFINQSK